MNKHVPKVGLVSLGCPKALVDSERIITQLRAEGYVMSPGYADADVVLVNTCGFLDSAKAESLAAIGEAMAENGRVIVTGCMGVEADTIMKAHPGVLAVTGPHQYEAVVGAVHKALPPVHDPKMDLVPPRYTARAATAPTAARCAPSSMTWRRNWETSARGCACITSTPTRTWMT